MIWKDSKSNALIVLREGIIYRGQREEQLDENILDEIELDLSDFASLPLIYIKRVEMWKGKKMIELFYQNDVSFDLIILDKATLKNIFETIRNECPHLMYTIDVIPLAKLSKSSLVAILTICCVYLIALFIQPPSTGFGGMRYSKSDGILNLLYGLHLIGPTKLTFVFFCLILFPVLNIWRLSRNQKVLELLS